jgi:uncharacterized protein involved in exopolysaccharide biosynthesis
VPQFSAAFVQEQQLERRVQVATNVYMQAITDRESAIAKELEETPAMVVLDPVPGQLPADERRLPLMILLGAIVGLVVACTVAIARGLVAADPASAGDLHRLREAMRELPFAPRSRSHSPRT